MAEAWRYELTPRALQDLERLNRDSRRRIFVALDRLIELGGRGNVRKLQDRDNEWHLRVGDWRVRFRYGSRHTS
jgi:mRNA-degrading endonuclease RelE of RelBE toxin-antitoxin system